MMRDWLGKDNDFIPSIQILVHTRAHTHTAVKTDVSREKTPSMFCFVGPSPRHLQETVCCSTLPTQCILVFLSVS